MKSSPDQSDQIINLAAISKSLQNVFFNIIMKLKTNI